MKHEGGDAILATLEALDLTGRSDAVRETHRLVTGYVRNNLHRMDYPRPRRRLADRLGSHRGGVQDGGQPAAEAERDAPGLRRSRRGLPPPSVVRRRNQSMGCLLGTIHQLMTQSSTNKKDAHPPSSPPGVSPGCHLAPATSPPGAEQ